MLIEKKYGEPDKKIMYFHCDVKRRKYEKVNVNNDRFGVCIVELWPGKPGAKKGSSQKTRKGSEPKSGKGYDPKPGAGKRSSESESESCTNSKGAAAEKAGS
jgi:hypothetical protein